MWAWSRHPNFAAEQAIWLTLYLWNAYRTEHYVQWTALGVIGLLAIFQGSTRLTEGISAGKYPEYHWFPGVLANASQSASYTAHTYHDYLRSNPAPSPAALQTYLTTLISTALGIHDPSPSEIDLLIADPGLAAYSFADMISRRAQAGWTTHGHSGADVNIYTSHSARAAPLSVYRQQ